MTKKKKHIWGWIVVGIGLILIGLGILFFASHIWVDGHFYPKKPQTLDVRDQTLTIEIFQKLEQALPQSQFQWMVPIQGQRYALDTRAISLHGLTEEDIQALEYLEHLETIDATDCPLTPLLLRLVQTYPEANVIYQVPLGGSNWPQDTKELKLSDFTEEEIPLVAYLPDLKKVDATACDDSEVLLLLAQTYPEITVDYQVSLGSTRYDRFATELTLEGEACSDLEEALNHMPTLRSVTLTEPVGAGTDYVSLAQAYPEISFQWSKTLLGITVTQETQEVDLSNAVITSLDQVEALMDWCPQAKQVFLGTCEIENEALAQFRDSKREQYKVVWNVQVGFLTLRTDDTYYMPGKYNLGVTQEQSYNLRYCEDMICIDVGHKPLFTCEWAAFMPHLKYLIIADTCITDLSPLEGLTELIYLEMFITQVTDYSPLLSCTALEDLNLCYTHGDPAPIQQMTWLKRLWWAESPIEVEEFQEYLPDTQLMFLHHSSTGNGWRQGQNYYDMRDILGMHYMWG